MEKCLHASKNLVWTKCGHDGEPFKSGRTELREQCADCGKLFGGARRKSLAGPDTPWVDAEGLKFRERQRQEAFRRQTEEWHARRERFAEDEARREMERQAYRAWYHAYLKTPAWAEKRDLVIRHAEGLCQGCGIQPAEQVHHLTYLNAGNEFLWELRAVCCECHERAHESERKLGHVL